MNAKYLVLACLTMAVATPALAAERWMATSSTSISVTGNLTISGNRLTFGNGRSVRLSPVGPSHPNTFTIKPADPKLNHGQTLCGGGAPPTFVQLQRNGGSLYFKVFEGPGLPPASSGMFGGGICALYNYERM